MAVITYWCQGKHSCKFQKKDVRDSAQFKQFFGVRINGIHQIESLAEAAGICHSKGGALAILETTEDVDDITKVFLKHGRGSLRDVNKFWISKDSRRDIGNIGLQLETPELERKLKCLSLERHYLNNFNFTTVGVIW